MKKEVVTYPSRDGKTTIYAEKYVPVGEIKGILIVAHGMNEHFGRYRELCEVLSNEGYLVAGPDHLGHGHTARDYQKEFGYFAENDGATIVVRDLHRLKKLVQEEYPDKPIILLGHSMGSFIARNYIEMYGTGIQGAIIMGSANFSDIVVWTGKVLLKLQSLFKGWHGKSSFYTGMAMGKFMKAFPEDGSMGWTCGRKESRDAAYADELMGGELTINGYYCLSDLILRMQDRNRMKAIPRDLPLLFMSGENDPIGAYGRGVNAAARSYKDIGMKNVKVKLYPGDRHEICNEEDRFNVFFDIIDFMKDVSKGWRG